MKIAVTATGPLLDDQVEARFGRTPYYLFIDTETMEFEAIQNPNVAAGGGAGIHSAQLMSEHGVKYVLTGNCGPNASQVFGAAGIQVIVGVSGTIRQAVERFKAGAFSASDQPNVASHFGIGGGQGMGGGRGMGMGGGRGMGMGGGQASFSGVAPQPQVSGKDDANVLKEEARALEKHLQDIKRRIDQLQKGKGNGVARVNAQKCNGCGVCVEYCPVDAITMNDIAIIDENKCTGCGICVDKCPLDAITMT